MSPSRPLLTEWNEGLRSKSFPRRVTAPNGYSRWETATGKTFATVEEACEA